MEDGAALLINLIVGCICGAIAAAIANGKGRSGVGWFFGGFFLGLIGIIIVACLSNLNEDKALRRQDREEKRRLREQLRQERLKSESFREYTMGRLDAHDEVLKIDTRETQTHLILPGGSAERSGERRLLVPGASNSATEAESAALPDETAQWYYSRDGVNSGPHSLREVQQLAAVGEVAQDTLVWSEALVEWTAAGNVPDLAPSIRTSP